MRCSKLYWLCGRTFIRGFTPDAFISIFNERFDLINKKQISNPERILFIPSKRNEHFMHLT